MPSHMTTLGFRAATSQDFEQLQQQTAQRGTIISLPAGYYIRWEVGQGIELWAQATPEKRLIWLNPHFNGASEVKINLTQRVPRPDTPLEGAFYAWANPYRSDEVSTGDYPFVFDAPDALTITAELPTLGMAQIAAFAHHLDAYPNEEAYYAAQEGGLVYGAESFIPTGTFQPEQLARAVFSGRVLATNVRVNPITNLIFHWAQVQTLGGVYDVVADPAVVNGHLQQGGIVSGAFWLSGRILELFS